MKTVKNHSIYTSKNTSQTKVKVKSKCAERGIKKSRFVKEQEEKGVWSSLGLKTQLSKISLFGDIFFWVYKMNEIVNKFSLAGDKFMPELHLKQPGFTYSACGPFTRNKERIEKFMQNGNTGFIYRNELDKACFQHDMVYGKLRGLIKRIQSDNVLRDKALKIESDLKYDGYQRGLASMVYKFFDKNSSGSGVELQQMNFIGRIIENWKDEKFIHCLETILGCWFSWYAITEQIKPRNQSFNVHNWFV